MTPSSNHDELRAQVSAYFDGELPPADEPIVIEHLATCEECQGLLGDTVGIHAAVQGAPRVEARAPMTRSPRRGAWLVAGAALAAAAALVIVWRTTRPTPRPPEAAVAIALAEHRAIEVRLSGGAFAAHRPYQIDRGSAARETVPLAVLAELERRGEQATLAAALASAGELERARAILEALPAAPAIAADRAALAILAGDAEAALAHADRAIVGGAVAGHWNRALALRELGYPLAAATAFDHAAASGDAWSAEATTRARSLRDDFARGRAAIADVTARGNAMIAGTGPSLTAADVETSALQSRFAFFDALRVAASVAALDALAPLADAIDARAPPDERFARIALDRIRAVELAIRAGFADRYRAVVARTASPDQIAALVRELARAGPAVADVLVGVTVLTATGPARLATLERLVAGNPDPWFARLLVIERIAAARPTRLAHAEVLARDALRGCAATLDFRCARLTRELGEIVGARGAVEEASRALEDAVVGFRRAGAPVWEDNTLVSAGDLHRVRGNWPMARAIFDELTGRASDAMPCTTQRLIQLGLAEVARYQGDLIVARGALPPPTSCDSVPDAQSLLTVVDLALQTGDAADRARARAWLEAARATGDRIVAVVEGRLDSDADPARARAILAAVMPRLTDPAYVTLAHRSFARAASATGDWAAILADADAELGRAAAAACTVVVNPDERVLIVAARGATGSAVGARLAIDDPDARGWTAPPLIVDAVAGCPTVAVIARPPLHGRSTLLPPTVPWAFVGAARPAPAAATTRAVIVADTEPPAADVRLPRLAATDLPRDAIAVTGAAATPSRVLAELATATYVELHAHGIANLAEPGTSFLALSPDRDGAWQLTAAAVASAKLAAHPVIVLGACRAAATTPRWDARWSLPDAFLTAGARAVIAADVDLPDREAAALFARLRARLASGEAPAAALAAERRAAVAAGQPWAAHLMVFE